MFVFVTIVFLTAFVFLGMRLVDLNKDKEQDAAEHIAERIFDEALLAQGVEDGYFRRFKVQKYILGKEINLSIDEVGTLILTVQDSQYYKDLPQPLIGGFCYNGTDRNYYNVTITRESGIVSVSSCQDCRYSYAMCKNAEDMLWCDWLSDPGLFPGFNETCCADHCLCC